VEDIAKATSIRQATMQKSPPIRRLIAVICVMAGAASSAPTGFTAYRDNKALNPSSLIGVAVLAADGVQVGKVVGISTATDGRVERIRMLTSTPVLGERTLIVAHPTFTLRRGAVMLDQSVDELQGLPAAMAQDGAAQ